MPQDALHHPWLQPVQDAALREELNLQLSQAAIDRRKARTGEGRRRLRASIQKVLAVRRLSGEFNPEAMKEALSRKASGGSPRSPHGGSPRSAGVVVVPPNLEGLRKLDEAHGSPNREGTRARRLSDSSVMSGVSYASDEMAPRQI